MSKESLPDEKTINAYHAYVQAEIRSDLNSISLGPGRLPCNAAKGLTVTGFIFLFIGVLLVTLRMRHVYFWDWGVQFVGPFFFILFLFCCAGATYLSIIATRRSNRFRRELYFHPLGDYGIAAVHKDDLVHRQEMKLDLKSGTNPHKVVKPSSDAYSAMKFKNGQSNEGYSRGPGDPRGRRPDDRDRNRDRSRDDRDRRHDRDDRGRRPQEGGRRPPDDRDRRRPPDNRYGPSEPRRGPPPQGEYRRGPPPDDRRRDDRPRDDRPRGPDDRPRGPDDRPRGPDDRPRGPPKFPDDEKRGPPRDERRPHFEERSPDDSREERRPRFEERSADEGREERRPRFQERSPDEGMTKIKLDDNKESESEL